MAQELTDPQFDSALGGDQTVPDELNVSDYIKHRMEEVVMLTEALDESPFRGQVFQRLPRHMRRRQMSHYIKRLPRRLQRPYLMSLKEEPPAPTKRPSRKYRRRPSNLLLEYNRRQKSSVWLETHIWHAKRFHMTAKWGYKLPEKPVNKSFRACYRAISEHCLLVDKSFFNCIELKGPEGELLEGLRQCTSPSCGLTFAAKTYLRGTREGHASLFQANRHPYGAIGEASFLWEAGTDGERRLWIWVHPLMHEETVECLRTVFELSEASAPAEPEVVVEKECLKVNKDKKKKKKGKIEEIKLQPKNVPFVRTPKYGNKRGTITMSLLKDTLNRFQLTGPLSQAVVSQAFTVASVQREVAVVEAKRRKLDETAEDTACWWERYYSVESRMNAWRAQKDFASSLGSSLSDVPSGMVLGLVIEDPRLRIPPKREKAVMTTDGGSQQTPVTGVDPRHSESPIWTPEIRDEVSLGKLTTQEINEARSRKIVPGTDVGDAIPEDRQSRVPVLLVHRPGRKTGKLGLGGGWDIISPAGFGMPIWLSLILRGARTGGLREQCLLELECGNLRGFPPPDAAAGETENRLNLKERKELYLKKPPDKRPNFAKLGVTRPFCLPWRALVREWTPERGKGTFCVLRDRGMLAELSETVERFPRGGWYLSRAFGAGGDRLVPVVVECSGKGSPRDLALICVPQDVDFATSAPVEPCHRDDNEETRKALKASHRKLLKSLRKRRRREKAKLKEEFAANLPGALTWREILKTNSAPSEEVSKEYNARMERLWLPGGEEEGEREGEGVTGPSSRRVVGFVVKGGFSYSRSRGLGLGYVALPGLAEVFGVCERNKSKVAVLVRNSDQVQYRFGNLKIAVE